MNNTNNTLTITSFNCRGAMSSCLYIDTLLAGCDILCLQEHHLFEDNKHFMESINNNCDHIISCASYIRSDGLRIRQGGVAIMWKKGMEMSIKHMVNVGNYIQVVQISSNRQEQLYLINVYLPAANHGYAAFDESIAQLYDLYHYYAQDGKVVICGDFNSRVRSGSRSLTSRVSDERRSNRLQMLLSDNNQFSLVASEMCQGPVETYLPYDGSSGTQIDHVIVHNDHVSMVRNVKVHDDHPTNTSDHLPITFVLAISVPSHDIQTRQLYRWDKADKQCYTYAMEQLLVDSDLTNVSINNENDVDDLCTCLMDSLKTVSDNTIPKSQYCSYKKPYWNTDLRNMHVEQKRLRRIWICAGRPRGNNHPSYVEYKTAKYLFAKSLKSYASEYEQSQFRDISLTKDLNIRQFWKYIRNGRRQRGGLTVINDGNIKYDTPEAQLDMWKTHFVRF